MDRKSNMERGRTIFLSFTTRYLVINRLTLARLLPSILLIRLPAPNLESEGGEMAAAYLSANLSATRSMESTDSTMDSSAPIMSNPPLQMYSGYAHHVRMHRCREGRETGPDAQQPVRLLRRHHAERGRRLEVDRQDGVIEPGEVMPMPYPPQCIPGSAGSPKCRAVAKTNLKLFRGFLDATNLTSLSLRSPPGKHRRSAATNPRG